MIFIELSEFMPDLAHISDHFKQAFTCGRHDRQFGVEIETLFVDGSSRLPIVRNTSILIMNGLATEKQWCSLKKDSDWNLELQCRCGTLTYDLGWNLLELSTRPVLISEAQDSYLAVREVLNDVYRVARQFGAIPLFCHFDGASNETLVLRDERDKLFRALDGPALSSIAHIASVHFNIDLASIEEGFRWMQLLDSLYKTNKWPPQESVDVWNAFVASSLANYERDRFGRPPLSFTRYCATLCGYKDYLSVDGAHVTVRSPPTILAECSNVDLEMFLRSVWWFSRLRVRQSRLVLEIRPIPREDDDALEKTFEEIVLLLDL